jgi:hypothetical protein
MAHHKYGVTVPPTEPSHTSSRIQTKQERKRREVSEEGCNMATWSDWCISKATLLQIMFKSTQPSRNTECLIGWTCAIPTETTTQKCDQHDLWVYRFNTEKLPLTHSHITALEGHQEIKISLNMRAVNFECSWRTSISFRRQSRGHETLKFASHKLFWKLRNGRLQF